MGAPDGEKERQAAFDDLGFDAIQRLFSSFMLEQREPDRAPPP